MSWIVEEKQTSDNSKNTRLTYRGIRGRSIEIQGASLPAVACNNEHAILEVPLVRVIPGWGVCFIPSLCVRWEERGRERELIRESRRDIRLSFPFAIASGEGIFHTGKTIDGMRSLIIPCAFSWGSSSTSSMNFIIFLRWKGKRKKRVSILKAKNKACLTLQKRSYTRWPLLS